MELRRYRSASVREGLSRGRTELGSRVVLLSSKKVNRRVWLPWIGGRDVEVTVAAAPQVSDVRPPARESDTRKDLDPSITELAARLHAGGVDRGMATEIAEGIPARRRRGMGYTGLVQVLAERFSSLVASDCEPKPIEVFVGPPGSGKTTTIAKLAARARARQGLRVGLVAADGYRVGAVEQLRIYAEVIGSPFTVVTTPSELERAMASRQEPVLIDTAGRSPGDHSARALFDCLAGRPDVRIHLVIDAGLSERQVVRVIDSYRDIRPDRIVITKIDQTESIGPLLGVLAEMGIPVSHLCVGQGVPDDIQPATAGGLAEAMLGETGTSESQRLAA